MKNLKKILEDYVNPLDLDKVLIKIRSKSHVMTTYKDYAEEKPPSWGPYR